MKFGFPIVEGITPGMEGFYKISHETYHSGPGISSTKIKKALVSYAAYAQEDSFDSAALAFGRAFHAALIEPELFAESYVVAREIEGNKNSNAYKAAYAAWAETVVGKEVLTGAEATAIAEMLRVVKEHPEYKHLPKFDAEVMGITVCADTGLQIKCKMDLFKSAIIDFKSTSSGLSPGDVIYDMVKWKYHVSAAFYQDIIKTLTGERMPFIVVPVTKKAPFECEFYKLSDELLEEGRKLYKAGLKRIKSWSSMKAEEASIADKKMRTLYPSSRLVYSSKEILDFIEGT